MLNHLPRLSYLIEIFDDDFIVDDLRFGTEGEETGSSEEGGALNGNDT